MADARLQQLERAYLAGDAPAGVAWLRARLRHGTLTPEQLELLAYLWFPPARELLGDELWFDGLDLWAVRHDELYEPESMAGPFVLDPVAQWSTEAWREGVRLALRCFKTRAEPPDVYVPFVADVLMAAQRETGLAWQERVRPALLDWVLHRPGLAPPASRPRIEPEGHVPLPGELELRPPARRLTEAKLSKIPAARRRLAALLGHPAAQTATGVEPPGDDRLWARDLADEGPEVAHRALIALGWEAYGAWRRVIHQRNQRPAACLLLAEHVRDAGEEAAVALAARWSRRPADLEQELLGDAKKQDLTAVQHLNRAWQARFAERVARWAAAAADPEQAAAGLTRAFGQAAALGDRWGYTLIRTTRLRAAIVRQLLPWVVGLKVPEPAARKRVLKKTHAALADALARERAAPA